MRKFIIDTDTASDDAVAIIMALREPSLKIVALTEVAGNVSLEHACQNASISIGMAGTYVPPIYAGCTLPLTRDQMFAPGAHGVNGLSDKVFPDPGHKPEAEHAVNAIIRIIREGDGDIGLITLGPLTNVALALRKAPDIAEKIPEIIMMAGAGLTQSARTPVAEFNILVDPEAANIVFESGIPTTLLPLEACYGDARVTAEDIATLRSFKNPTADFCVDANYQLTQLNKERYGEEIISLPDPTAVAYAAKPELAVEKFTAKIRVDTSRSLCYGQTVLDVKAPEEEKQSVFVPKIDGKAFKEYVFSLVR